MLFVFSLALSPSTASQPDSLTTKLSQTKDPAELYDLHLQIASSVWRQSFDTSMYHLEMAQKIAVRLKDASKNYKALSLMGSLLNDTERYHQAIEFSETMLQNPDIQSNPSWLAATYSSIAGSYTQLNLKAKAIENFNKAIEHIEKGDDDNDKASFYGRFGNLCYRNSMWEDAIRYYNKANALFKKLDKKQGIALTLMNTGSCYKQMAQPDSAIGYYTSALNLFKEIGNLPLNEAQCLANLGNLNFELKRFSVAKRYLHKADSIFSRIDNPHSLSLIKRDLANLYIEINQPDLAKPQIDKCLELSNKHNFVFVKLAAFRSLWKYYETTGDCQLSYSSFKQYITLKDSLDWAEKEENFDQLLAEFEVERKENEIKLLKQTDEINQLKIRRRTLNLYISLFAFIVSILFVAILYKSNQRRKKTNELLLSQNTEINQQKEEIIAQRDEIESQRDLLQNQNSMLEQFRTHTNHSLRYAQSIQAAILPSEKLLQQISPENFVLMKPCELVSGDFFWVTSFDEYHIFCVSDCTGHGVPGAFMSILGITALNDIVARHRVTKPAEILGYLRSSVIEALSQNDPEQLHKDGMDIGICSLNKKTRELQFAGAGIPLWLVSMESESISTDCSTDATIKNGYSLCEIKGDIMPVGMSPRMKPFTNRIINLPQTPVSLYIATDGFADQLKWDKRTKFGVSELKNLLLTNAHEKMKVQHKFLDIAFNDWKGTNYQVDDVTILGVNI